MRLRGHCRHAVALDDLTKGSAVADNANERHVVARGAADVATCARGPGIGVCGGLILELEQRAENLPRLGPPVPPVRVQVAVAAQFAVERGPPRRSRSTEGGEFGQDGLGVVAAQRAQVAPLVGGGGRLNHRPPTQQRAVAELAQVGAVKLLGSCHRRTK